MKRPLIALVCSMPLFAPLAAEARPVRITATLKAYSGEGAYVRHLIAADAAFLRSLVGAGAQILVCGGVEMAEGVRQALTATARACVQRSQCPRIRRIS